MKNEKKITKPKSTSRKAVVQAMAKQDKEIQKTALTNFEQIHDAIRLKAYELYVERGANNGNDVDDWLVAERMILEKSR